MAFADYSSLFNAAEQKYGLRPGTGAALMSLEDASGNPYARSPAGAQGILQLMPGTAREVGVTNPNDPSQNIDGGLHYFSNILNGPAHGDYRMAAMGYNAGPNRTSFPQSTQNYADQFISRLPAQNSESVQSGAPPVARPSLASMMNAQQPVNAGQAPDQVPAPSLGALASSMPQGNIPQPSKFTAGNVLGVLGDALSAYGGRQPTFGPFLQQEKILQQQQDFERQKFQQELQMRMFALTHPPEWMQAQAFNYLPPEQQRTILHYQDATNPINVSTPQGTQNLPRTATRTINGKNYYSIGGQWFEEDGQ